MHLILPHAGEVYKAGQLIDALYGEYTHVVAKVTFILESGEKIVAEAEIGETLTQVAYRAGVRIQQSCGGSPSCGDCVIKVDPSSHPEAFEPMEHAEMALLGNVYFITKERLACQTTVKNDSTVHVPNAKSKAEQGKRGKPR